MIIDTDVILYGPLASRPAAIVWGGLYITSDSGAMYRYNGSTWDGVNLFPQSYLLAAVRGGLETGLVLRVFLGVAICRRSGGCIARAGGL